MKLFTLLSGLVGFGILFSSPAASQERLDVLQSADLPAVLVQLDIIYDENEPATILVPFGQTGTLETAQRHLEVTPQIDGRSKRIHLDLEVSAAESRSDVLSAVSTSIEDGGIYRVSDTGLSVGAQVVHSKRLQPVAEMSTSEKLAICDALSSSSSWACD